MLDLMQVRGAQRVALAGCREVAGGPAAALYPNPDVPPMMAALDGVGLRAVAVAWDDPDVEWDRYGCVLVAGTWDSVDRPDAYLAWTERVASATRIVNSAPTLAWALDKASYLRDLEADGVAVVPTEWVTPGAQWSPPVHAGELVIKPAVSAAGRATARYSSGDPAAAAHVHALTAAGRTVMVQPYLAGVDQQGEIDVTYLGGVASHAVAKRPALAVGEGVVERPWERMAWSGLVDPDGAQQALAERTMKAVVARLGAVPVYARVDLVPGPHDAPVVIEVEMVDPYLSLDLAPAGAARLASLLTA